MYMYIEALIVEILVVGWVKFFSPSKEFKAPVIGQSELPTCSFRLLARASPKENNCRSRIRIRYILIVEPKRGTCRQSSMASKRPLITLFMGEKFSGLMTGCLRIEFHGRCGWALIIGNLVLDEQLHDP